MRLTSCLLLTASLGCAPDAVDTDVDAGLGPVVVDLDGTWGPDPAPRGRVRALHLRFDVGDVALAFNETGIVVADGVPPGGVTPLLPTPADEVSVQAWIDGEVVASSEILPVDGGFGQVGVFGTPEDPRSLAMRIDPTPADAGVKARFVHTTPGLPYVGLVDVTAGPVAGATYGEATEPFVFQADTAQRWALDLTGDGRPNLPLESFELPLVDSLGNGQVVDVFAVPTGATLPGPFPLPVPALLVVPLDAPDGLVVVRPDAG